MYCQLLMTVPAHEYEVLPHTLLCLAALIGTAIPAEMMPGKIGDTEIERLQLEESDRPYSTTFTTYESAALPALPSGQLLIGLNAPDRAAISQALTQLAQRQKHQDLALSEEPLGNAHVHIAEYSMKDDTED